MRLAGVNWYGVETADAIAHGLWAQDYHAILSQIKAGGYNTDLQGLNSLEIMDRIVSADASGVWYTRAFPESKWIVEGTDCFDAHCDWWGGNLAGVANNPVTLDVEGQLVYSAHDYGPTEYRQPWFGAATTPGSQGQWFQAMTDWLQRRGQLH